MTAPLKPEDVSRLKARILDQWESEVRASIPPAANLGRDELRNGMPAFLDCLLSLLYASHDAAQAAQLHKRVVVTAREHGERRAAHKQYALDIVIDEYRILRRAIFANLESETAPLDPRQKEILLDLVDYGISEAATEFAARYGFPSSKLRLKLDEDVREAREQLIASKLETRLVRDQLDTSMGRVGILEEEKGLRERWVYTLSHDLRSPLTAAAAAADLVIRRAGDRTAVVKLASRIGSSLERADRMIRDLLDVTRIRGGEPLPIELRKTELRSVVEEVIQELATIYGDRFVLQAPERVEGRWSDEGIRRALENLCSNAVKYGDPVAPITVTIRREAEEAVIEVHNFGKPLDPREAPALFDAFKRAASAQQAGVPGWGIGLMLVKGIAEAHHGTVSVASGPGKGNTFILRLPVDPTVRPVAA